MVKLSIIIPAYNEEKTIEKTLKVYMNFFNKELKNNYEIIIIPNGCKDKTVEKVDKLSKKYKEVKYFDMGSPGDKGKAVKKGFEIAKGDLIGFVDADLSTPPSAFYDLLVNIKDNHGIIASRWVKGAEIDAKQPIFRRFLGRGYNFLVRAILGLKLTDTQCGAKLFTKKAIKMVAPKLGIAQWGWDIDLLYLMQIHGFKVIEIPTTWKELGDSHLNVKKTVPEMFLSLIRLRLIYSPLNIIIKFYDLLPENITFKRWLK